MKELIEVTWCTCGTKIIRPRPEKLFGERIICPSHLCKKEFIVTHSILRDRDTDEGVLEYETNKAFQPRQSTLQEFIE